MSRFHVLNKAAYKTPVGTPEDWDEFCESDSYLSCISLPLRADGMWEGEKAESAPTRHYVRPGRHRPEAYPVPLELWPHWVPRHPVARTYKMQLTHPDGTFWQALEWSFDDYAGLDSLLIGVIAVRETEERLGVQLFGSALARRSWA